MEKTIEKKFLGDTVIMKKLSSGMKCYIIPKMGYQSKMAVICTRFGSNDITYRLVGSKEKKNTPQGIAHFIEHKLFEQEWGDAFSAFVENGASANAFTDFQKTAYYFSCIEKFEENLALLLRFVQNPYFTKEGTESEKKIISSEITMYDDEPSWSSYFNLLKALYHNHPIKNPIAGSVETIQGIQKGDLLECYEAFYTPENMVLICAGDVNPQEILEQSGRNTKKQTKTRAVTVYDEEPNAIVRPYIEKNMGITTPMFQIGFKEAPHEKMGLEKETAMELALDLLAGESSDFLYSSYEKDILEDSIGFQYLWGEGFAFSAFSGTASQPKEVAELLLEHIKRIRQEGVATNDFERIKKKHIGQMVRGSNSVNALCISQLDLGLKDSNLHEKFHVLKKTKKEDVERIFQDCLKEQQMAVSVVK